MEQLFTFYKVGAVKNETVKLSITSEETNKFQDLVLHILFSFVPLVMAFQ